jgi:hypothetical protein
VSPAACSIITIQRNDVATYMIHIPWHLWNTPYAHNSGVCNHALGYFIVQALDTILKVLPKVLSAIELIGTKTLILGLSEFCFIFRNENLIQPLGNIGIVMR